MLQYEITIQRGDIPGTPYQWALKYKDGQLTSVIIDGQEGAIEPKVEYLQAIVDFLQAVPHTLQKEG